MKYILLLFVATSYLFGYTVQKGSFESCETNYYSMYEVQFVTNDDTPCHELKSKLRTEVYSSITKSFKKGSFESRGLFGCPIDFVPIK